MTDITKPGPTGKWEVVRRLRYGALLKLFRHRYGYEFPDDDAGRDDLFVLLCVVSLAPSATDKKMAHVIDVWAPWMPDWERDMLVEHVNRLTIYERMPAAQVLGERVQPHQRRKRAAATVADQASGYDCRAVDGTAKG